jgi:hypothetical protein
MFNECRHILPSGYKCKSPALRGQAYCYFHTALRRYGESRARDKQEPLLIPSIEDTRGIQIAVSQIIAALGSRQIDPNNARLYLSALRIAAQLADRTTDPTSHKPEKTVRTLAYENDDTLAPEKTTCEPPADCVQCRRRAACSAFRLHRGRVEELEQLLVNEQKLRAEIPDLETCTPKPRDQE